MGEAVTDKVSVIIPARKEPYLKQTLRDLYANAEDEIETIVILDGWEPNPGLRRYKGMKILKHDAPLGMRPSIMEAVDAATGKYIMKIDAHCSIGPGWDAILKADCADNWIVVPRRYRWDAPNWKIYVDRNGKQSPAYDRMEYNYPFKRPYYPRLTGRPNQWKAEQRVDILIDEDMTFQGSCWFMQKAHFNRIGGMDAELYRSTFGEEPQEIGLKTQLGPWQGAIMRNKKTWYAHWSKPGAHWMAPPEIAGRVTDEERENSYRFAWDFWWNNRWKDRVHDFDWLVDKFWPLKDWPENWRWEVKQFTRFKMSELWPSLR